MMKKAVIDIDNTLWHFCDVLYEQLKAFNPAMPFPDNWIHWDFWMHYCSENEFFSAINRIHLNQDDDAHLPYAEARSFLETLKSLGFYIVIASHRTTESYMQTDRWLRKHDLIFDELYLSYDKTVLFDKTCHIVVDDSPIVLEKAAEKGIYAAGLAFPWNRTAANNGFKLCENLNDILKRLNIVE